MRRLVVALLVALLALTFVGCGGGEDPPAEPTAAPVPAPAPAPTPAEDLGPIPDRSAEESAVFAPFPTVDGMPAALAEAIRQQRPTIILFVDGAQKDTNDMRAQVDKVVRENQGLIDPFIFDLGKYASIKPDGTIVVDKADLNKDPNAVGAVRIASELGVNFTPYVYITDDQGHLIYRHSGYIDWELLDAQVQRVTD